jgi:uncharacterized membrane protein (DUF373 family)
VRRFNQFKLWFTETTKDANFLRMIHYVENAISKILSIVLVIVILVAVFELIVVLFNDFISYPFGRLEKSLLDVFGLFLNILIALELLENITAYLRKHIVQVELVIVTSLIAVARKIIIFDFNKFGNLDLIALAFAILALSASYWLIKRGVAKNIK